MTTMTVSQARAALPEIINRVLAGDEVTLTRHGEPVVVIVRPDRLRARRAGAGLAAVGRVRDALESARQTPLDKQATLTSERAEELAREVQAGRSSH